MATTATQKSRASASKTETSASRHQRKCTICHHADREEIEQMFLHWFSASSIYRRFLLKDRSSIYDHAHAAGLYSRRRKNMRCALENIIERSDECPISSNGIVRAIKAYCSLTDSGEWIEPASRVVYTSTSAPRETNPNAVPPEYLDSVHASAPPVYAEVRRASHATVSPASAPQPTTSAAPLAHHASQNMTHSSPAPNSRNCNVGPDRSYRAEGVHSTPLPSASTPTHATNTSAPFTGAPTCLPKAASSVQLPASRIPNRYNKLLETNATRTKQRSGPHSNRYK